MHVSHLFVVQRSMINIHWHPLQEPELEEAEKISNDLQTNCDDK